MDIEKLKDALRQVEELRELNRRMQADIAKLAEEQDKAEAEADFLLAEFHKLNDDLQQQNRQHND